MTAEPHPGAREAAFDAALGEAGRSLGLDCQGLVPLRVHGSGIYLLPAEAIVARIVETSDESRARAATAMRVTGWLTAQGFPATQPAHDTPVETAGTLITLWRHLPQPDTGQPLTRRAAALGELLRQLHRLSAPPFPIPAVDPLARLRRAIALDHARSAPVLSDGDRALLTERMSTAHTAYQRLDFPLGHGLIHNDAHLGNLLVAANRQHGYVLGDWEGTGRGPREIDLVQEGAPGNRFRETDGARDAFTRAYRYDIARWPGWQALRDLRDLHSLAAYIRTAPTKPAARHELGHRLDSLRTGQSTRPWRGIA